MTSNPSAPKPSKKLQDYNTAPILNPSISLKPSKNLKDYISKIKITENLPIGISDIVFKNKAKNKREIPSTKLDYLVTEEDRDFIRSVIVDPKEDYFPKLPLKQSTVDPADKLLSLQDVFWLYKYIQKENELTDEKVYLHDLIEGSDIMLPKNEEIPRNEELDKRCAKLKAEQENREYHKMTRNVDATKKRYPEDTLAYQMNQMNRHLVAILQFVLTVAAGFAFGFIGIELLIGYQDFGFKLLLGIICALVVALAELYFLAKKLNEDLQFEQYVEKQQKTHKLD